ncbi:carbohydrate ABC transporter permease [Microbacterium invictum]|uniref:Raffinose/stachyose/melibiose transport system permease protein n=1 Tax=Microbacterium invictum TaxID=515415 RepID=A0AA40SQ89_9MICO|nr:MULTISPECIES: sugar ABC transporter permease [Microbacterium]MBB4140262.1 raffinose/stachyose/melibiose transport system permease protein [Microbacterium invictum]
MTTTAHAPRTEHDGVVYDEAGSANAQRRGRRFNTIWLFALPALIPYLFVVIIPSVQGITFSFTDWNGLNPDWSWVGFDNYVRLINDKAAVGAVVNTLTLAVVVTIFENVIGLALALALNTRIKSRNALRLVFFAPVVVLSVVVAFLWQFIYTPSGPINQVLEAIGLGELAQNWLGDPDLALGAISVIMIWQFSGYAMVIYLAGLQGVPQEQLEAAALDGAGAFKRFWYVVRPLLAPAITVNLMLALIRGLMAFDQIWVTTQGGPAQSTETLSTLVYRNAFQYGEFSYSAAIAVVLSLFVAALAIVQYRLLNRSGKNA